MNRLTFRLIIVLSCIALHLSGQYDLSEALKPIFEDVIKEGASVAISIRDDKGDEIGSLDANRLLMPASTLKLVTTLNAALALGANYQFKTALYYRGEIAGGSLYGDLILLPSGDPSFGSPRDPNAVRSKELLDAIGAKLKAMHINCITGKFIIIDDHYDKTAVHPSWPWDDLANYYAAGSFAFNYLENYYSVAFNRSDHAHQPTDIASIDPIMPVYLDNKVMTGEKGSGDEAYFYGDPYGTRYSIEGTIPPGKSTFTVKGAIPSPVDIFVNELRVHQSWPQLDIISGTMKELEGAHLLYSHQSRELYELIAYANEVSNNLYCDSFLKAIVTEGPKGFSSGCKVIQSKWKEQLGDKYPLQIVDGSGLSMRNRLTAAGMTKFLHEMIKVIGADQLKSMIPSVEKSSYFLLNEKRRDRCWLKSGSMDGVQCYAGMIENRHGDSYTIALMSNGHMISNRQIRSKYEIVLKTLMDNIDN